MPKPRAIRQQAAGALRVPEQSPKRPSVPLLRFLGATETVTGSRFLIDTPDARVLVDCGLFQGLKALRERNWATFPVDPASIDAVVLTHAHLDHTGYVPALTRNGFSGRLFATEGTVALSRIVLPDSGHIQEEDAAYANRKGFSKHAAGTAAVHGGGRVARACNASRRCRMTRVQRGGNGSPRHLPSRRAHPRLSERGDRPRQWAPSAPLVFSGDLGRPHHPILRPPAPLPAADVVLVESTYGDRQHEDVESLRRFEEAIVRTAERGGVVLIPSFAVDRTEVILFHLRRSDARRADSRAAGVRRQPHGAGDAGDLPARADRGQPGGAGASCRTRAIRSTPVS